MHTLLMQMAQITGNTVLIHPYEKLLDVLKTVLFLGKYQEDNNF